MQTEFSEIQTIGL